MSKVTNKLTSFLSDADVRVEKIEAGHYGLDSGSCMDCEWGGLLTECIEFEEEVDDYSGRVFSYPLCPICGGGIEDYYSSEFEEEE